MPKHRNFIVRLLNRKLPSDTALQGEIIIVTQAGEEPGTAAGLKEKPVGNAPAAAVGPTICKGGKLYRARLRNGRWETIGAPIGTC